MPSHRETTTRPPGGEAGRGLPTQRGARCALMLEVVWEVTSALRASTEVPRELGGARTRPPRLLLGEPGESSHFAETLQVLDGLSVVRDAVGCECRDDRARELGARPAAFESARASAGTDLARIVAVRCGLVPAARAGLELGLFRLVVARRQGEHVSPLVLVHRELEAAGAAVESAVCDQTKVRAHAAILRVGAVPSACIAPDAFGRSTAEAPP
jgi:hypothetical protein